MKSLRILASLALPAALLLAGCSVKAPVRTSWSLSGGASSGEPRLATDGPALGVLRFTAAPEVRTTALTWRDGEGHLLHESADSWVDYPDRMLEEMASSRLLRAGRFRSVTAAPPREGLDAILACRLVEFGEWDSGDVMEARVTIRWQLTSPGADVIGSGEATGRSPVAAKSMDAVVRAHSDAADAALARLVDQVADAASRRAGAP